jgi:sugar O-acyltransferase (sialic acid O-acetyltransferase NeuD family)
LKYCIFGSSGSAKEVFFLAKDLGIRVQVFFDLEAKENLYDTPVLGEHLFDSREHKAIVAIGNPWLRKRIVDKLKSKDSEFYTLIHPTVRRSATVSIGLGSVVSVNSVLTCDISLGEHSQLNSATTIGHECSLGDYFTTAPGVNIAGNVTTGKCVFFGINSSCIQKITIANDVFVGAGACVVKDLSKSGMYLGTPAKWLPKEFMPEDK